MTDLTKQDVEKLQAAIDRVEHKVDNMRQGMQKMERYLYDDDDTSSSGIVSTQRNHGDRLSVLEEDKRVRNRLLITLGTIGGLVGTALLEFIKWMFTMHHT